MALNEKFRIYRASKPAGTWRANHLWAFYRIRLPEYARLLEKQDDRCAICLDEFKGSRDRHLDHLHGCDHPGKGYVCCAACVRGVLCHKCNTGLSIMEDAERFARALSYLGAVIST